MSEGFVYIIGIREWGQESYSFIDKVSNLKVAIKNFQRLKMGKHSEKFKWFSALKDRGAKFDVQVIQVVPQNEGQRIMDSWATVLTYMGSQLLNEKYKGLHKPETEKINIDGNEITLNWTDNATEEIDSWVDKVE